MQDILQRTGLKASWLQECSIFFYHPDDTTAVDISINNGHHLATDFSMRDVRAAYMIDVSNRRSPTVLQFFYSLNDDYYNGGRPGFPRGDVDASNAYNVWMSKELTYPGSKYRQQFALDAIPARKIPYREHELKYEIQPYAYLPDTGILATAKKACTAEPDYGKCFCVQSSGYLP